MTKFFDSKLLTGVIEMILVFGLLYIFMSFLGFSIESLVNAETIKSISSLATAIGTMALAIFAMMALGEYKKSNYHADAMDRMNRVFHTLKSQTSRDILYADVLHAHIHLVSFANKANEHLNEETRSHCGDVSGMKFDYEGFEKLVEKYESVELVIENIKGIDYQLGLLLKSQEVNDNYLKLVKCWGEISINFMPLIILIRLKNFAGCINGEILNMFIKEMLKTAESEEATWLVYDWESKRFSSVDGFSDQLSEMFNSIGSSERKLVESIVDAV